MTDFPAWLIGCMEMHKVVLWGVADCESFPLPKTKQGGVFLLALSWAIPVNPHIMADIRNGPNHAYADEYTRLNERINELGRVLAGEIRGRGYRAQPLAASDRTDPVNIKGDFPHKTAATRAGLGWIGRHCQLVTRRFGPWVRLGTVFTDMPLPVAKPLERSFCGRCTRCVDACPATALTGRAGTRDCRVKKFWTPEHVTNGRKAIISVTIRVTSAAYARQSAYIKTSEKGAKES